MPRRVGDSFVDGAVAVIIDSVAHLGDRSDETGAASVAAADTDGAPAGASESQHRAEPGRHARARIGVVVHDAVTVVVETVADLGLRSDRARVRPRADRTLS